MDSIPDSKVHGANMGPIWGRQDPGGPHVGPMKFAIWVLLCCESFIRILQSCFSGAAAIVWLPKCLWSNPEEDG